MTLFGWDASDFDWNRGPVDLKAAHADGIRFFTHKLTEHAPEKVYYHAKIEQAVPRAIDAGFRFIGAYIVPRSNVAASAQVDSALQHAERLAWQNIEGWFWQIDSEHWSYDAVPLHIGTEMCRLLEERTKRKVVHYASVGHYGPGWGQPFPRWNPNYSLFRRNMHYREYYDKAGGDNGPGWVGNAQIWQYTDSAKIGSQNVVKDPSNGQWVGSDANAFRGSEDDFATMIGMPDVSVGLFIS